MTEDRYSQFLDEFGERMQNAADAGAGASRRRRFGRSAGARADMRRRTRVRLLFASTLCAAAAAVAVLLIVPGSGSSGDLVRAAAAITAPGPDTVLYESWEATGAPVASSQPSRTVGPDQLWLEEAPPRHYRLIVQPRSGPATNRGARLWAEYGGGIGFGGDPYWLEELEAAVAGHPLEIGGELENPDEHAQPPRSFTFTPPSTLWSGRFRAPLGAPLPTASDESNETVADPVSALREAIAEGRAEEEGSRELDGQTLRRITFKPHAPPSDAAAPPTQPSESGGDYALVQAETFRPVEIVLGGTTYRFRAYEYLPASEANLALASIQAQHPHAQVITDTAPGRTGSNEAVAAY